MQKLLCNSTLQRILPKNQAEFSKPNEIRLDDFNVTMIMMNSAEFLANIFDLFHGIVHRMSKVVVLLHFADPSFRPRPRPQKSTLEGNGEKARR